MFNAVCVVCNRKRKRSTNLKLLKDMTGMTSNIHRMAALLDETEHETEHETEKDATAPVAKTSSFLTTISEVGDFIKTVISSIGSTTIITSSSADDDDDKVDDKVNDKVGDKVDDSVTDETTMLSSKPDDSDIHEDESNIASSIDLKATTIYTDTDNA